MNSLPSLVTQADIVPSPSRTIPLTGSVLGEWKDVPVRITNLANIPGRKRRSGSLITDRTKKPARGRIDGCADLGDYSLKNAIGIRRDRVASTSWPRATEGISLSTTKAFIHMVSRGRQPRLAPARCLAGERTGLRGSITICDHAGDRTLARSMTSRPCRVAMMRSISFSSLPKMCMALRAALRLPSAVC